MPFTAMLPLLASNEQTRHVTSGAFSLCYATWKCAEELNTVSQVTPPPKKGHQKGRTTFLFDVIEFGGLYLNGQAFHVSIHDCSGPDQQDGVHGRN
jgi:hypothetical protein